MQDSYAIEDGELACSLDNFDKIFSKYSDPESITLIYNEKPIVKIKWAYKEWDFYGFHWGYKSKKSEALCEILRRCGISLAKWNHSKIYTLPLKITSPIIIRAGERKTYDTELYLQYMAGNPDTPSPKEYGDFILSQLKFAYNVLFQEGTRKRSAANSVLKHIYELDKLYNYYCYDFEDIVIDHNNEKIKCASKNDKGFYIYLIDADPYRYTSFDSNGTNRATKGMDGLMNEVFSVDIPPDMPEEIVRLMYKC